MRDHSLFAKLSKCEFGRKEIEYLGHIVSGVGVAADHTKVAAMLDWLTPRIVKELRGFLGLTGYYRRFIKGYGSISKPLTQLLQKDNFNWCPEADLAFSQLKVAMSSTPVLILPDFSKQFVVECDAFGQGIGAVLMQDNKPIAFLSKALCGKNLGLSTYEKEMMAILYAIKKWHHYLVGFHFSIRTDHQSLKYFLEQKITTLL